MHDTTQKLMDTWLEELRDTLRRSGAPPDEIEQLVDDMRWHILDALSEIPHPSPRQVQELLSSIDRPDTFVDPSRATPPHDPTTRPMASLALGLMLAGPLVGMLVAALASALGHDGGHVGWVFFCAQELCALILGLAQREDPRARVAVLGSMSLVLGALVLATLFGNAPT